MSCRANAKCVGLQDEYQLNTQSADCEQTFMQSYVMHSFIINAWFAIADN